MHTYIPVFVNLLSFVVYLLLYSSTPGSTQYSVDWLQKVETIVRDKPGWFQFFLSQSCIGLFEPVRRNNKPKLCARTLTLLDKKFKYCGAEHSITLTRLLTKQVD